MQEGDGPMVVLMLRCMEKLRGKEQGSPMLPNSSK